MGRDKPKVVKFTCPKFLARFNQRLKVSNFIHLFAVGENPFSIEKLSQKFEGNSE